MNKPAPQLFAGACLTRDQNGTIGLRGALGMTCDLAHSKILAENPIGLR